MSKKSETDAEKWLTELFEKKEESKEGFVFVHCPSCGYSFSHEKLIGGKIAGGAGGATTGAILGAKIGIALGPLGAIAGTIPGAILGGVFGRNLGNKYDKPRCPKCSTKFEIPENLK
jgi:hypothetical protein